VTPVSIPQKTGSGASGRGLASSVTVVNAGLAGGRERGQEGMGSVVRLADRLALKKAGAGKPRAAQQEQRFRYPGPDAVSEISCRTAGASARRDEHRARRRVG